MPVNKRFFMDHMADRRMSLREVAKQMDIWPAALSRSLDGKRKMQLPEAVRLSQVLSIPLTEVLANAGIEAAKSTSRRCDVLAYYTGTGEIVYAPKDSLERIPIPDGVPDDVIAVSYRTSDSPLSFTDGWVTFLGPRVTPNELLGLYCGVLVENDEKMVFALLRRGYEAGTFNLYGNNGYRLENARIAWARRCILTMH
ncbi:putative transcriptional regulator [Erwinia phage Pavtok]|uniref:Putative transcriptional regulator n=1 Tax=Erwinia phage Pavtok TaxID=2267655 RepID=A0A345BLZ8_9CAUD|nr:putative transcriptional regulator [Erwinia phage Pavtok]AXF51469.1 putative transcriptional regulator [Erwinia phage Pavtok]